MNISSSKMPKIQDCSKNRLRNIKHPKWTYVSDLDKIHPMIHVQIATLGSVGKTCGLGRSWLYFLSRPASRPASQPADQPTCKWIINTPIFI